MASWENGSGIVGLARGTHLSKAAAPRYRADASTLVPGACRRRRAHAAAPGRLTPCLKPVSRVRGRAEPGRKCLMVPLPNVVLPMGAAMFHSRKRFLSYCPRGKRASEKGVGSGAEPPKLAELTWRHFLGLGETGRILYLWK